MKGVFISREQLVTFMRAAGWRHKDQTKRVEMYGRGTDRVPVARRDRFTELQVRIVLSQASFPREAIEQFLRDAVKS
jgi:hypothetical protein